MTIYTSKETTERVYKPLQEGKHRVRIEDVEVKTSKAGNQMYKFTFEVSGSKSKLFYHFVFKGTDMYPIQDKIDQMNNCFGIDSGTKYDDQVAPVFMIGKIGGVEVEHTEYDGKTQASVKWLLWRSEVDKLSAWQDSEGSMKYDKEISAEDIDDVIPF